MSQMHQRIMLEVIKQQGANPHAKRAEVIALTAIALGTSKDTVAAALEEAIRQNQPAAAAQKPKPGMRAHLFNVGTMTLLLVSAYAGTVMGVDGALNVSMALVWMFLLPAACVSVTSMAILSMAKVPKAPILLVGINRACRWTALGLLVWHGCWATSSAMAFSFLLAAYHRDQVARIRGDAGGEVGHG